jgi:Arc/MetJ-type ribon-helix-helix transcriptional regulator
MKVSVSLPGTDIEFLDEYAREQGFESRSAVVHKAVRLLRASGLSDDYEEAWSEWNKAGEARAWESVTGDGIHS